MMEVVVEGPELVLVEKIKKKQEKRIKKGKLYVPKDEELRLEVIWLYYDIPVARYRGR